MKLTVFTPTYNRKELLKVAYVAMKRQTCKEFIWLIVDDGSTDDTESEVARWIESETEFEIRYIYKENGGLHTAYNVAIANMDTELCVCVDSDDYLVDTGVEEILMFWEKNGSEEYAGIVGLDCTTEGEIIGDLLPAQKSINLIDLLLGKYSLRNGDRKNVVRTELYKAVAPMPSFKNEKNFNPHYMHLQISEKYDFLVYNKPLCCVDYQPNGMTASIYKQYLNSPNSFLQIRKLYLSFKNAPLKFTIRNMIHYVSSSILAKQFKQSFIETNKKLLFLLCIIPGLILSLIIRRKGK